MSKAVMKQYDAYKDSGVEWIGETPDQWEVTRNKDIFEERGNLSASGTETLLTVSHITGVTQRAEKNVNMFMAETMEGYKLCEKGDLIINTMWAWMGALGTCNENGICSPAYGVYKPKKDKPYNHRYLDYLYRTPNSITEMTKNSKGIVSSRLRLYPKEFFQIKTALPDYTTQNAIADYLDTKTAQLDRKINLLTQKATQYSKLKQSLINETVTRGLDKSVAMKDSGVEWIGEVPEHWGISKLSQAFSQIGSGTTPKSGTDIYYEGGTTNWINTGDLNDNILHSCKKKVTDEALKEYSLTIYPAGSIIIAMYGATIGKVSVSMIDGCTNQACCVLNKSKVIQAKFLFYWFLSKRDFIISLSYGGGQPNISQDTIKSLRLILPLIEEQNAIANYLDEKTAHIDRIVITINTQIDKLKELRKTLINDVVTGKIKVA